MEIKRKPFDLVAARSGAPLVTRRGIPAKFVVHIPEAVKGYRVVALVGGGALIFTSKTAH